MKKIYSAPDDPLPNMPFAMIDDKGFAIFHL
jgi:hypothetical protein